MHATAGKARSRKFAKKVSKITHLGDASPLHPSRNTMEGTLMEGGSKWARFCDTVRPNDDQTNEKGTATMKLTTNTNVSGDGVMQGLGGPEEDRSGGVWRGGGGPAQFPEGNPGFLGPGYPRARPFL